MTLPLYHVVAAGAPDPAAIFTRAQTVWSARAAPAYESFTVPCEETFLASQCEAGTVVQFIVRLADGRTFAQTLTSDGHPATVLLRGGYAFGPAGAPFGFYRRVPLPGATLAPRPPNLIEDPIATIATVSAVDRAYDIALVGTEAVDGHSCYYLRLRPLRDPQAYPLRELWVDTAVTYDFAPVGASGFWSIVHIDAAAVSHGLFATHAEHVSEDLHNITFPASEPDADFSP